MFLKLKTKRLLKKHFIKSEGISKDCYWEIVKIMFNKKLFKQYKMFIYMVCDYKERKGECTIVQLDALQRITNG